MHIATEAPDHVKDGGQIAYIVGHPRGLNLTFSTTNTYYIYCIMSDVTADGFNSSPFLKELYDGLQDPELKKKAIGGVKAVIVITLKNKEGKDQSWVLDLKKEGTISKADSAPKSDVQLLLKDADFVKLANGKANGQKLFMNGKLKVKGNMMKATAIESVFKQIDPRPKSKL